MAFEFSLCGCLPVEKRPQRLDWDAPAATVPVTLRGDILADAAAYFGGVAAGQLREFRDGEDEFSGAERGLDKVDEVFGGHRGHHLANAGLRWVPR